MSRHLDVKLIRETLTAMLIALVADSLAGYAMNLSVDVFVAIPGLLMMIPALIDMRGNIYGAFISRLSSSLHLGEVESLSDEKVKIGVATTKSLAYSAAMVIGLVVGGYIGFSTGRWELVVFLPAVILVTHLFTASILTPLTAYIGVKTFQKGWNPDNVGVPLISSVGDVVSVVFIVLVALFLIPLYPYPLLVSVIVALVGVYLLLLLRRVMGSRDGRKVYGQSMPVLIAIAMMELITGGMWEANKIALILLLLPPMLETLGNLGSVFSSRLTSFIYLGFVEPSAIPRGRHMRREILSVFVLALIIYSIISAFVLAVTFEIRAIVMVWLSAAISLTVLVLIAYYLTVGSLKMKLDPDNVVVPVITTLADIVGTFSLIAVYHLIF